MSGGRISHSLRQRWLFLAVGNLALLAFIAIMLRDAGSFGQALARAGPNVAPIVLAALGMTGLVYCGAIDLSVGSIVAVAGSVFAILVHREAPAGIAFAACLATGLGLSLLNGAIVRVLGIPAIIVTLAGLPFYRGAALILSEAAIPHFSGNLSIYEEAYHVPGRGGAGWILFSVLLAALVWEACAKTPRRWLALGCSEEACRLLGIKPGGVLLSAYFVSGLFLGLASLIHVTRVQSIEPARMALGFELEVIGAVVLGGTNIFGGEGSYLGTVLGAFFLYLIAEALIYAGVSPYYQEVVTGGVILSVIGINCALGRPRKLIEELQ